MAWVMRPGTGPTGSAMLVSSVITSRVSFGLTSF